jgi:hypothetical protein
MILINDDLRVSPKGLTAEHTYCPVSDCCIPLIIRSLFVLSIRILWEDFTSWSFRDQVTLGLGKPVTGHRSLNIRPWIIRRSCPMVMLASSRLPSPVTRPDIDLIWGFNPAKIKRKKRPLKNIRHFKVEEEVLMWFTLKLESLPNLRMFGQIYYLNGQPSKARECERECERECMVLGDRILSYLRLLKACFSVSIYPNIRKLEKNSLILVWFFFWWSSFFKHINLIYPVPFQSLSKLRNGN